jgi:hypothetical protein
MNSERLLAELGRLEEILRLVRNAQALATKPDERWRLVSELVTVEKRLLRMKRRQMSDARSEMSEVRGARTQFKLQNETGSARVHEYSRGPVPGERKRERGTT